MRLRTRLAELPQKRSILEIRKKLTQAQDKDSKVQALAAESDRKFQALQDEATLTSSQIQQAQQALASSCDYRETSVLSKELEVLARRADTLDQDSIQQMEQRDKIDAVAAQLARASDQLKAEEEAVTESYQTTGGAIQQELSEIARTRAILLGSLDAQVRERYERASATLGGSGAARLENNQCSGCHFMLSEGQIANLQAGPLISECPNCSRLLVARTP